MPDVLAIVLGVGIGIVFIGGALFLAFRNEFRARPRPRRLPAETDTVDRGPGGMGMMSPPD